MLILAELRHRFRYVVGPVLGFCVVAYFLYHSVEGDRGIVAWQQLQGQIKMARDSLNALSAERAALERRVSLLRADHLDPDLLEERARLVLNYLHSSEVVVLYPRNNDLGE